MTLQEAFSKVVFLLGAGASKEAGCLLSGEMLTALKIAIDAIPADDPVAAYKEDFEEIYGFIRASLNYQATMKDPSAGSAVNSNIEDFVMVLRQLIDKEFIIPYPLIGNWNAKILKWELSRGDIFAQFKKFITKRLVEEWTQFDQQKANAVLEPFRSALTQSEPFQINLFSLNYDLIFETTLNNEQAETLQNGFATRRIHDQSVRYWTGEFDQMAPTKVNLYKLHGSLDWEYNNTSEEISIKDDVLDGDEPLIIFGSYSKMLSFDPFLFLLSTFRKYLEEATLFVVIGYSFHDKYINNLLIQQLSRNTADDVPKKLLVVDPSRNGQSESSFADELRRIQESRSIEDVINFKQVSPDRIRIIGFGASQFYSEYFSNNAATLVEELEAIQSGDRPFTDSEDLFTVGPFDA